MGAEKNFLRSYFKYLAALLLFALCLLIPYSFWWLYESGDLALERAIENQAKGNFVIFGSGVSQDFVEYKLKLYAKVKPEIIAIGSSRVMQFRKAWFKKPFLNMGGVAGNLSILRMTIDEALKIHKPEAMIIGVDFWWFMPQWEAKPELRQTPPSGSYNYSLENLKKPYTWLIEGKISLKEFLAPVFGIFGQGFRTNRYGIMAQQTDDGFGPDGSWYYTGEITGRKPPFDFQFTDTLKQIEYGIKAFYHTEENAPANSHLDVFAEIYRHLQAREIKTFVFIAPLSNRAYAEMKKMKGKYPHLFKLRQSLLERGINVLDFSDPQTLDSDDCEFIDGFHGGEITYARILRQMAEHWTALLPYININKLDEAIQNWHGYAMQPDNAVTVESEKDFMHFNCPGKR